LIVHLSRIIYSQWTAVTADWDLTPPQNKILRILGEKNSQPITDLGNAMSCTKSNLTGVIDSMARRGLVRRVRNPQDRRILQINLTEKSKRILSSIPGWTEIYRDSLTHKLKEKEVSVLKAILSKLYTLYSKSQKRTRRKNV
jgi:DNA-binding MarR family transcriptional regulator